MLVKSPFARGYTDIAEKLEQSLYCFGGDGGGNGGGSSQEADMDKEMAAIDAEFNAMDEAYESGTSFTSEGVTTDSSDDRDSSQDVRESITEPGKTYNFNINRTADYSIDEQGRRVYDTLDQQMMDLYEASGTFERLDSLYKTGTMSVVDPEGKVMSREEQLTRDFNVAENSLDALDAIYADPRYADKLASLMIEDPITGELKPRGDLQILLRENQDILVTDPDMFDQFMAKAGAAIGNTILGQLTGGIGGMLGFKVGGALDQGPLGANLGYYGGKVFGQGGFLGINGGTFQAQAWESPLTGENVLEQTFNNPFTGNSTTYFTTESEFAERRAQEEALKEKYESGEVKGDAQAFSQAVTGKRKPSWRDYVAGANGSFVDDLFSNLVGGGALDTLSEPIRDSIVLAKNLADGGDPLTALVGVFGDDVDELLGLSDKASAALDEVFDPKTAQWMRDNRDLAFLGADIVIHGKDPSQAIAERYGDAIVKGLGATSTNQVAAARAGLNIAVALDQGVDANEAIGKGVIDYFREGGRLADLVGTEFKNLLPDVPDGINLGFSIPDLGIDWKGTWDSLQIPANDILSKFDFMAALDMGFDLGEFDVDAPDFNVDLSEYSLGDFNERGYSLADLEDVGIDIGDLNIDLPQIELELQLAQAMETIPGTRVTGNGDEVIQSLESEFDFLPEEATLSRATLGRRFT
jgi:hypothetical protein